jgi:hypothetical protein
MKADRLAALARDLAGVAGAACVAYGAWLVYHPAGFIVGGALLVAGTVLFERGE